MSPWILWAEVVTLTLTLTLYISTGILSEAPDEFLPFTLHNDATSDEYAEMRDYFLHCQRCKQFTALDIATLHVKGNTVPNGMTESKFRQSVNVFQIIAPSSE